jgi:2-polyprenyl-3-methyl-5-hydroxy-6-metoxy-1,4-benzoquinol methylase
MYHRIKSILNNPQKGWDPVAEAYAIDYATRTYEGFGPIRESMHEIQEKMGSLKGKKILDLGGGPGAHSIAFAKEGATVTWHDVSRNYMKFTQQKASEHNVTIDFSIGYMEEAKKFEKESFDLVFNNLCWYYCRDDNAFAQMIFDLTKPGGFVFINNQQINRQSGLINRVAYFSHRFLHYKLTSTSSGKGEVPGLFLKYDLDFLKVEYSTFKDIWLEKIFLRKK